MNQFPGIYQDLDNGQKVVCVYFPVNRNLGEDPRDARVVSVPALARELTDPGVETASGCWTTDTFIKRFKKIL